MTPTLLPGGQNTVTLQSGVRDYQGVCDTYISQYSPTSNYALQANLMIKNDGVQQGLLRFDLSCLPENAVVRQATLRLFAYNRDRNLAMDLQVLPLLRAWMDLQATWNRAAAEQPWGLAGASQVGTDRVADPVAVQSMLAINAWYEFDITQLVAAWTSNSTTNLGLLLRGLGAQSVVYHIASANYTNMALRPQLVIDYTTP
jgi:hypothetical protein